MKRKTRITETDDASIIKQYITNSENSAKCSHCKQKYEDIIFYNGHPNNSSEEFISLTNENLLIFTGEEEFLHERDSRPIHRLTGYSVYDDEGHLTTFDNELVEENVVLRLSGYIKPIFAEDPSVDDGIPTHDIGPINAWYISGFDGGENACVGIISAYAEYMLMDPSPEYARVISHFLKKVSLLKIIIEFLLDFGWENPTYEDLLYHLQSSGNMEFGAEFVLQNAHFICKQVYSFESAGPDEEPLMNIPCMETLVELSGIVLNKLKKSRSSRRNVIKHVDKKATSTKLVRSVFENFFPEQIDVKNEKFQKKKRCGICDACQAPDCGKCLNCKSMVKFGGSGKSKQACKLRKCPNMELEDSDNSDVEDLEENLTSQGIRKWFSYRPVTNKVEWPSDPVFIENEKKYYDCAIVGGITVLPGDYVMINPDVPNQPLIIGKIVSLFTKHNEATFHAEMFCRGEQTILGETAHPQELFVVNECEDCPLGSIVGKAEVIFRNYSESDEFQDYLNNEYRFFFNKRYDSKTARFTHHVEEELEMEMCSCCRKRDEKQKFEERIFEDDRVKWRGQIYIKGTSVFLDPSVYTFPSATSRQVEDDEPQIKVDEEIYPEYYRKSLDVKNPTEDIPEPFCIGQIEDIFLNKKYDEIKIKVRIFYRPENTKNHIFLAHEKDLNLVYWTDEVTTTSFDNVICKCYLRFCDVNEAEDWSENGPLRFYYTEGYNPKNFQHFEVPFKATKGKGKKSKINVETFPEWGKLDRPLRCMDVFAGCGGLSLGLHQAGVAETKWAVENMYQPAEAFKINNDNCKVYTEDCNKFLKDVMSENSGSKNFPKKGDVEILVGGPPCQGFSHMNRFSARQYSLLKNSLIVTLLSICDFYRPKYFVLENVRNFASFRRSMVLKLTIRCLLAMDYQVAFGILQAAHYGLPQTRRRFILIAAAPGCVLPNLPSPQSAFERRDYHLSVTVDGVKYYKDHFWSESAPYRPMCVRDAISDLPSIANGFNKDKMSYDDEAVSHFQRRMRGNDSNTVLYDHICKEMAPIVEARISHIPCIPGSDWRDLPNICMKLRDNTMTNKLQYLYYSKKQKKFDLPRAVCQCSIGKNCNPVDRQVNTLIPWCLPHTADRHNNWAGLYGRLGWDEVFKTTITNPEPIGKQGKVIHPEQNRVVSVRECARSQGFPDHFRFFGNIMDKHRQIGNAVPPPMGKAIGLEIRKVLSKKSN